MMCLQVSVSSTGEDGKEVARMVLDHEGNPEWKCYSCDFRYVFSDTLVGRMNDLLLCACTSHKYF